LRGNVKSHFYAINRFRRPHTHLTIIDSDNLMDAAYLKELDKFLTKVFPQCKVCANLKTLILHSLLGCRQGYLLPFLRRPGGFLHLVHLRRFQVPVWLLPPHFTRNAWRITEVSGAGFDKVLQYAILQKIIGLLLHMMQWCLTKKTSHTDQLVNQRARWINTWFKYWWLGFFFGGTRYYNPQPQPVAIWHNAAKATFVYVPYFINGKCLFINVLVLSWGMLWWVAAFAIFVTGFMIALFAIRH